MGTLGLGKDWPWLIVIAVLVGVTMSIAAYSIGSGTTTVTLLSAALVALALAQVAGLMRGSSSASLVSKLADNQAEIVETVNRLSNETRRINAESQNLARNVDQFRQETSGLNDGLAEGLASLRQSHEQVSDSLKAILDAQQKIQASLAARPQHALLDDAISREQLWIAQLTEPATVAAVEVETPAPHAASFENSGLTEALTMALEPIVDLFTSNTAHYRMVLGMTNEQGKDVEQDVFLHHADRMGLRAALDQHMIGQSIELVQQLRQRDEAISVFVPVGTATLGSTETVRSIIEMLQQASGQANSIVLDIPHAVLASLPEASLEGLATFARAGVHLSLSQASISGIDLSALNSLNVRWVGLAASSVGVGLQISAGLQGFIQSARALRIQVIISQVGDPRHVQGLSRTARFASGPAFAMPRKLKRTEPDTSDYSAAA
jgi:EAL domain-containing protein (putative c-di-GMP-specific phosphodiesterase class I)